MAKRKKVLHSHHPVDAHVLRVSLSELGHKDEAFDTLDEALGEMHARYPHAVVSRWSKTKRVDHYGEPVSYRVAKWSHQARPKTRTGWASMYDGKIVIYYTSEIDPTERAAFRRRAFEVY